MPSSPDMDTDDSAQCENEARHNPITRRIILELAGGFKTSFGHRCSPCFGRR